jgi:hypothetical protein
MPKLVLACLVAALWALASCVLNPQPEPPGSSNDTKTTGGSGIPTGVGSTSGAGGSGTTGGFGGAGGAIIGPGGGSGGASFDAAVPPIVDASADVFSRADGSVDGSLVDGGFKDEASTADGPEPSEAGDAGPSEAGSTDGDAGDNALDD